MSKPYDGKVVLVTGANSGIGETIAVKFAEAGAKVFGLARRKEALAEARERHPNIHWLLADVTKAGQVKAAVESLGREAGRLDVLVNNAALFFLVPLEQTSEEQIRSQLEANVLGPTVMTQAALPLIKASRGSIVNISSVVGHKPAPGASVYAATKAALESLTRSWALELAPHGVRVNAVAPGPVETGGFAKAGIPAEMVPVVVAKFVEQVPLGRAGSTDEVARWVVAIAEPSVTWVTGQVLSIDGGMSLT